MEETLSTGVKKQSFKAGTWKTPEILLATLVCILLIWYLHFLWSRRKLYHCSRRLPGPSVLTLLECFLRCIINPHSLFPFAMKLCDEHSGIFRVWFGPRLFLVTSEPKHYEILLAHCLSKDKWYNFGEQAVGHGLFNAPLKTWKKHRKTIMPTFNQKILDGFVEIFSEQSQILVEQMEKFAGKGEFDVFEELITKCTVDIICETAMGVKVSNQTTDDRPVSKWIDRVLENMFVRMFVFHYHFDAIFNLTARSKGDRAALKNFHDFSGSVIKEKKQLLDKARKQRKDSEDFVEERKRKVFLDYLLEITTDGNQFTEQELRDEVNTFVITGSDTTASTIAFVLIMLGLHKELQEKVYGEIIEVVGPKRTVEKDDLPKLCHMDRFIKETLRLFPVAGFIARATEEEVDLGDQVIPGGVSVVFMILSTHTNKRFWPDPFKFDPDRFLPEEVEKRHPCAYIPFSYGRRNCIGMKYAMMSMKTLLATVMRKFKFDTSYKSVKEIELKFNTVMRPKDGYKLSLEPR
uniref:Cytochrome P450 n=1 Tax=Anoplophora glabripennis TaxID=217634 RepID=A0A8F8QQG8_ANOGL|nr:cytochrome P450 [Anoplophora glabripennis]